MDNFMDKLAKRFNSGEIMRANAAAEAREMKRAKEQAAEYERMMQEMRRLNLKNVEVTEQVQQLIQAGIEQFEEYGNDGQQLKNLEAQNKQMCEFLSIMKEELQQTYASMSKENKDAYVQEMNKLQQLLEDALSGEDMTESMKAAQIETVEGIKQLQGDMSQSMNSVREELAACVQNTQKSTEELVACMQNAQKSGEELVVCVQNAHKSTEEQVASAQNEIEDCVKSLHTQQMDGLKEAKTELAQNINLAKEDTVSSIKNIKTETIETIEGLKALHNDTTQSIETVKKEIEEALARIESENSGNQETLKIKLDEINKALETLQEKLSPENGEDRQLLEEIKASITSIHPIINGLQDYVHRENVKVYRNVQAVILDIASQKTRDLGDRIDALEKRIGTIKGVTPLVITTMIFALISTLLQVLSVFGVF